jgi:cytochrome c oxidase subunit III
VKKGRLTAGRIGLIGTILLGFLFLGLTYLDDTEELLHLTPRTDSYGSIFFTIISIHGLHLTLGLLMLFWVLFLPRGEPALRTPHRPYHNAALYRHFVDTVWVFIIAILYVSPHVYNAL